MEKRRLGKTGHMSSVLALGGAAIGTVGQTEADRAIEMAIEHGINHIDVAPLYGEAEVRLGPWLQHHRQEIFLGCKTREREKNRAWESIKRSLDRLRVSRFDLFQFHGADSLETLDVILGPGGALEAALEAKEEGLLDYIGITGHRPFVYLEALTRFDFDTVLFPLSRVHAGHPDEDNNFMPLLDACQQKDVGVIAIKAISKTSWGSNPRTYKTWYEPFDTQEEIDRSLWYTLSNPVTTCPLPSDLSLWPLVIDAAERLTALSPADIEEALDEVTELRPISAPGQTR